MPATVVVDASVAVTWFHSAGEPEVGEARALLALGPPLVPTPEERRLAVRLAADHGL